MRKRLMVWVFGGTATLALLTLVLGSGSERSVLRANPVRLSLGSAAGRAAPKPTPAASALPAVTTANAQNGVSSEQVFHAPWGAATGELGKKAANESSPEGPASFAVDARGRAFVLDQVNGRVQIFEPGLKPRSVPLPGDTYQDVALRSDDGIVLLDRLTKETVAFADASGKVTHEIRLQGEGVVEAGDVTGLFQRNDGTWVEVKHANLVQIADADGAPLEDRTIVQGRMAADGKVLRASKSGSHAAYVAEKTSDGDGGASPGRLRHAGVAAARRTDTEGRGARVSGGESLLEEVRRAPLPGDRGARSGGRARRRRSRASARGSSGQHRRRGELSPHPDRRRWRPVSPGHPLGLVRRRLLGLRRQGLAGPLALARHHRRSPPTRPTTSSPSRPTGARSLAAA